LYVADRVLGLSQYHRDGRLGSTIVYDKPAPIFRPGEPRDFVTFEAQKEELRQSVFNPENVRHYQELVTYWTEHETVRARELRQRDGL
jgi:hypothetical protein